MNKYSVFICSLKNPNVFLNQQSEGITMKIYDLLRQRLNSQGFGNVVVDSQRYIESTELTQDEIQLLEDHPFFISEHYLAKPLYLEPNQQAAKRVLAPWRAKPSLDAYTFADRGKRPLFSINVLGAPNTGKTYFLQELKQLLKEKVPACEVILCDNDYNTDCFDVYSDPEAVKYYRQQLLSLNPNVVIGNGPTWNMTVNGEVEHSVNFD